MRTPSSFLRALAGIALLGTLGGCIFTTENIPAFLQNTSGSEQTVAPNAAAAKPLTVTVRDQNQNLLSDVEVTWFIKSGAGTLSAASSTTNSQGVATVNYTAGASTGNTTIIASIPELGASVAFIITVQ